MDIKLKDFEGPLDLLLHLVSKYQMDIYDVPITEVIEQYLAYVSTLQAMRLEVAGEYMVMASQLMLIKSRKLLPKVAEVSDLEDDLEQDLLSQIEEYRKFKLLGEQLEVRHQERAQYYSKAPTELIYEDAELVHDKTTIDLFLAFSTLLAKKKEEFSKSHTTILRDEYKIEDMMVMVREALVEDQQLCLQNLFKETKDLQEIITLFLATLELIKTQEILLIQEESFGDIYLMKKKEENQVEQSQA
ncbi:segregation/condensation protein A [Streptococcus taonis]|uniref:Segregation and condensation protein A n=1 Tax=Streptococcus taonis TaxID=3041623 RepID=A0ABT6PEZ7_9STRE|nr:segregation/condensation protein A [Streptococcus sp. ST22-14]MDI1474501.1 segregation/condensation protein A [Streptococcus sp. ST22-14]